MILRLTREKLCFFMILFDFTETVTEVDNFRQATIAAKNAVGSDLQTDLTLQNSGDGFLSVVKNIIQFLSNQKMNCVAKWFKRQTITHFIINFGNIF